MSWIERRPAGDTNQGWYSIAASVDGVNLIAGVLGGRLYTSADGGANWTERQPAGNVNGNWMTVASDADGSNLLAANNGGRVYISTNSGATWAETQPAGAGNLYWRACASDDDGSNLVVAANQGYLYTSSNGGTSWTQRAPGGASNRYWYGVASDSDGSNLIACGLNDYVYTSSDGGATWTKQFAASTNQWYSVASDSDGSNLIAVYANAGADGVIYTSSNSGATWTARWPAGSGVYKMWYSAASNSDGSILLAGSSTRLYSSNNGGATWTEEQPAGNADKSWHAVAVGSGGTILSAGVNGGRLYTAIAAMSVAAQLCSAYKAALHYEDWSFGGIKDTFLDADAPNTNHGAESGIDIAYNAATGLLSFDCSMLPADTVITSATLLFAFVGANPYPYEPTITAYRLLYSDWNELEATWNQYRLGLGWGAAGALESGVDYAPDGASPPGTWSGDGFAFDVTDIVQAVVQQNNGDAFSGIADFLLVDTNPGDAQVMHFYSADNSYAPRRPFLTCAFDLYSHMHAYSTVISAFRSLSSAPSVVHSLVWPFKFQLTHVP